MIIPASLNNALLSGSNESEEVVFLTKQDVRDAMALALSVNETVNVGSIEDKMNRVDKNTQQI